MPGERVILHVDMDAFFASVEQLDHPEWRGRPLLVGHDGPRGVVAAASYEAREFGCHSAQPIAVAKRLCPDALIVPGRGHRYREVSRAVFAILESLTPLVQPLSIDEAFLDVTGTAEGCAAARTIAADLKRRIRSATGVTGSVGVAPNKFLAKLASDWEKPDGLTVITPEELPARLAPLPIARMWGVGPAMERKLASLGVRTFGDLQALARAEAVRLLGSTGDHFWRLARGEDRRPVAVDGRAKSISSEQTFEHDLASPEHVRETLLGQCEHVARRLRRHGLFGRTVTVKIRFGAFQTITRSSTLGAATDRTDVVWTTARELFESWCREGFRPVRLVGVGVSHLEGEAGRQLDLFGDGDDARQRTLDRTLDAIEAKFGRRAIHRGQAAPRASAGWDVRQTPEIDEL